MSKKVTIGLSLAVGLPSDLRLAGSSTRRPKRRPRRCRSRSARCRVPSAPRTSPARTMQEGWPKDLSSFRATRSGPSASARHFRREPELVFPLGGGELPNIPRPQTRLLTEVGPNVQFPVPGLPWRNANTASPPGAGASRQIPPRAWKCGAALAALPRDGRRCALASQYHGGGRAGTHRDWTQWDTVQAAARRLHQSVRCAEARLIVDDTPMRSTYFPGRQAAAADDRNPNVPGADGCISTGRPSSRGCRRDLLRGRRI